MIALFQKIKIFLIGSIFGIIGTLLVVFYIQSTQTKPSSSATVKTTQISGEKIEHSNWTFSGKDISFQTDSAGVGVSTTTIPKELIPEVRAYLEKTNIVQFDIIFLNNNGKFVTLLDLSYFKRFHNVAIGGGFVFSKNILSDNIYGAKLGVQYGF